jgi:hypothetical protein
MGDSSPRDRTRSDTSDPVEERLAQLERLVRQQHEQMTRQQAQIADQHEQVIRQQAQIIRLEAERGGAGGPIIDAAPEASSERDGPAAGQRGGSKRSRRALLKLGGAAAAAGVAATAALVTSEGAQTAHAADGGSLLIGNANLGTSQTSLAITGSSSASPFFFVDASGSTNNDAVAIQGSSNVTFGIGVVGGANTANGAGVLGFSNGGTGVYGNSDPSTGYGLFGNSNNGTGVSGHSSSGTGVYAQSSTFVGVHGVGNSVTGVGGWFEGGRTPLVLGLGAAPGAPTANQHFMGDIYLDKAATAWVCIGDGVPGTWVRLASVANGALGGVITYLSTPVRLLDARTSSSSGLVNRGALGGNEVYTFAVAGLGGSGIPNSAQGLIGNVTILGPSAAGNLSLFPAGGAVPTVASMTFGTAGLFLANGVNVAIGSGGAINIQNQSDGTTPLVLDAVAFVS